MKKNKVTILSIIVVIVSSLTIIGTHSIKFVRELENQINDRDILIKQLQQKDSTIQKADSLQSGISMPATQFTHNGKPITPDELVRYVNKLTGEISSLNDSLEYYQTYYKLSQKNIKSDFSVKDSGTKRTYSYKSSSLDIDTVNSILKSGLEKSSLEWSTKLKEEYKRNTELQNKLNMYERAINRYGIQFNNIKKEGNTISYEIEAPQVDSALLLLPFYRKELKYDKKKKQWTIGIKRFF